MPMLKIDIDFESREFEESISAQVRQNIETQLHAAGFAHLAVKMKREDGYLAFHLDGDEADIEKAKKLFDFE